MQQRHLVKKSKIDVARKISILLTCVLFFFDNMFPVHSGSFIQYGIQIAALLSLTLFFSTNALSSSLSISTSDQKPQITFGIIADIQYAPIPDGYSYGGRPRYYRHSLAAARHAAHNFQKHNLPLVVNLGDIIDGKCQEIEIHCKEELHDFVPPPEGSDPGHDAIDDVMEALSVYKGKIMHTYGNHELYNLDRAALGEKLNIPFVKEPCGELVGYYSHDSPCKKVKFVVIDSYDIAMMQRCPNTSLKRKQAMRIMAENNPNYPRQENSPEGMEGTQKRFVAFNGGVGETQLEWLRSTLEQAKKDEQKVIILSHQPILPGSSGDVCLIWNYSDVLDILREYKSTVACALAGHAHKGGYSRDTSGIHFRVIEAALESKDPIKTFGYVHVYDDRLEIEGEGDCGSAIYKLDHLSS